MPPFTILSNTNVKSLLASLSRTDVTHIADSFLQSLLQYSVHNEQDHQPSRAVVKRGTQTTLFMPATTPYHTGVKIVGISPPKVEDSGTPKPGLQATLTLCDAEGNAIGVLNAAEITAFRTALGSMLLYRFRKRTERIVVFGAGAQARWHIRLALLLRGEEIKNITIVNRSRARTQELLEGLREVGAVPEHVEMGVFKEEEGERGGLENLLVDADVIFCGVPSTTPLFPASYLNSERARTKTRYIAAIGSYRLDMQELDPELIRAVADPRGVFAHQGWQGCIAVDSVEGCLTEAGELVKAGVEEEKMVEVGKIQDMLESGGTEGLRGWLESGFVIYKSVGVGIMDIAIGSKLLELAREKGLGVHLEDF